MIDLHTHTTFSDGELIPSELVRRAQVMGYTTIGLTDHVDFTNMDFVLNNIFKIKYLETVFNMKILAGVELTHVPPKKISEIVALARDLGAEIIIVHGETPVEPVMPGTNRAAIEAGVDILAHPGFIEIDEAEMAKENDVCLEVTSRLGHNITNGHVVRMAKESGAKLVVNTDTHSPDDLIDADRAVEIAIGAGLNREEAVKIVVDNPLIH